MSDETKTENAGGGLRSAGLFFWDFFKVLVIAALIIVPVRWFLFQPFVVTGPSMKPNFHDGDYLIIDELSYHLREPARGEVVVLRYPNDPTQFFIKRLAGLPGERIVIRNNRVEVFSAAYPNGLILAEPYLPKDNVTFGSLDVTLGPGEYYVLGDNRVSSSDSRVWGKLPRRDIIGRVYLRAFPLNQFRLFITPVYSNG